MPPANQAAGMNDTPGISDWFNSLPLITRYWFGAAGGLTLAGNFGIVSPLSLLYDFPSIRDAFHVWRLLTSFLYVGSFSINTLMGLYMLYQFSKQYEGGGPYNTGAGGGTADYLFCLLFGMVGCITAFHLLGGIIPIAPLFTRNLTFYVLYVWGRKNPNVDANIWGVPVKGMCECKVDRYSGRMRGDCCCILVPCMWWLREIHRLSYSISYVRLCGAE